MCQFHDSPQSIMSLRHCDHIRGCINAKFILIEYGDFQCSQSGQLYWVLKTLTQQLEQNLCFVFRHLPQAEQHPRAQIAAEATEAAHTQGKFWEMHDLLFEHQNALEDADLLEYAIALNLNIPQFLKELTNHAHATVVKNHIDSAKKHGISKAPAILILIQPDSIINITEFAAAVLNLLIRITLHPLKEMPD